MNPRLRETVTDVSATVSRSVTAYVLGTVAMGLLFGLVVFITLMILGVPFALLLGLWVALVAMIPLVGGLIGGVPTVALALLHSPTAGVVTAIVFIGFQVIENHFLYPVVMSRTVRMNPLWVLLSVLIGANLGGVFGSSLGCADGGAGGDPGGRSHPGRVPRGVGADPCRRRPATWDDAAGGGGVAGASGAPSGPDRRSGAQVGA